MTIKVQEYKEDTFYQTSYTSRTASGIQELYEELDFACHTCRKRRADSKMAIQDTYHPTFVVMRKRNCQHCWLRMINNT
jgi:transposase